MNTKNLKTYMLVLSVLLVCQCGTETDSTSTTNADPDSAGTTGTSSTTAVQVGNAICTLLETCFADNRAPISCSNIVLTATTLEAKLGLTAGTYSTLNDIALAETGQQITASSTNTTSCLSEITSQSCSSTAVTSAYDNTDRGILEAPENAIPTGTCQSVYQ